MTFSQLAFWGVIAALSLMLIGGLVLWAYGARAPHNAIVPIVPEAEATRQFHQRLSRWFFIYGMAMIVTGLILLVGSGNYFLRH